MSRKPMDDAEISYLEDWLPSDEQTADAILRLIARVRAEAATVATLHRVRQKAEKRELEALQEADELRADLAQWRTELAGLRADTVALEQRGDELARLLGLAMGWSVLGDRDAHAEQWHAFQVEVAKALGEEPPLSEAEQEAFVDRMMPTASEP